MIDKDNFCEKVRSLEGAMYRLAFSLLKNEYDAADAMSEAVFRAYCNLASLRKESAFKTWMLRIVHNTSMELLKKRRDTLDIDEQFDLSAEEPCVDTATRLTLQNAVHRLRQPYRTVILLFYYENLPIAQIAQITDTGSAAVRKQLSRAREMLKEILEKEGFNK